MTTISASGDGTAQSHPGSLESSESSFKLATADANVTLDSNEKEKASAVATNSLSGKERDGIALPTKFQQYRIYCLIFVLSVIWLTATIVVAFLSSLSQPIAALSNPKTIVLVLTMGSGVSVFLLGQLLTSAFDRLRWTLAGRSKGVDLATFLGLSRATDFFGVIRLVFSSNHFRSPKWCVQRYVRPPRTRT